jgi:hypothetical protein
MIYTLLQLEYFGWGFYRPFREVTDIQRGADNRRVNNRTWV